MTALTDLQLANLAAVGGWEGDDRVKAIAVALAETGGRPTTDARGDVALQTAKWGPSIGPWQVRSLKAEKGTGGVRDESALLQPTHNATSAHRIYADAGNRFTPWTTYVSGAYLLFMPRAKAVAAQGSAESSAHSDPVSENPLSAVADAVTVAKHAAAWMTNPKSWTRVAFVVIGGGLVLGAAVVLAKPVIEPVASAAAKAL